MWKLNRQTRYMIIRELINSADPTTIENLITNYGFENDSANYNIDVRKNELLDYFDEMHKCWNEHYTDVTDRQYVKVLDNSKSKK